MARADIELLVNDALLLDTVEGLDSIAARLAVLAGHLERSRATAPAAGALTGMVVELGWWPAAWRAGSRTPRRPPSTGWRRQMEPDGQQQRAVGSAAMARQPRRSIEHAVAELVVSLAAPSAHLDRAVVALAVAAEADRLARAEVIAARELDGASWADVGKALGVSRQTAHERFRTGPDGMHSRLFKRGPVDEHE